MRLLDFIDPIQERFQELGVVLQPGGVEVESERSFVLIVVAVEVVVQEIVELVAGEDVGARIDHGTAGQVLVVAGVFTAVELVHHHLPDGVAPGGATLQIAVTTMRHAEIHSVGPQRRVRQWGGNRAVVQESLFFHHRELIVASHTEVRRTDTYDAVVGNVCELFDNYSHAGHFLTPVIDRSVAPEAFVVIVPANNNTMLNRYNIDTSMRCECKINKKETYVIECTAISCPFLWVSCTAE